MYKKNIFVFIALSMVLVACAAPTTQIARGGSDAIGEERKKQYELALRLNLERAERLNRLAWPILSHNAALCGGTIVPSIGVNTIVRDNLPNQYRSVAGALGIDNQLRITYALGPAAAAGLQKGDIITAVQGQDIDAGVGGQKTFFHVVRASFEERDKIDMTVQRGDKIISRTLTPVEICSYPVRLVNSDARNAYADGEAIYITTGMMRFAENDKELQLVIAHELAHNSESHIDKKKTNMWIGTFFDVLAAGYGIDTQSGFAKMGAAQHGQDFEREADYVGMYMLARAGIDAKETAYFWRRMAAESPANARQNYNSTHPSTPERFTNIEASYQEIERKKQAGQELLPERLKN